ncbi:MAG: class I SAM-dependent methyltransferase [Acidimicrobiia bacterium]|nr:class I SAM-dependent methyltransferase [Acidimicrobiia bacterium]
MLTVDFDRLDLRDGHTVLDMGCGGGRHAFEALRRGATVVALDYDREGLSDVRATSGAMLEAGELPHGPRGGAVNGDALELPFPDGCFDRVIAAEVLEHLPADERAIAELTRVLAPGGRMAVTVPSRAPERLCWALDRDYHDTPGGHVRIYRRRELEEKLARAGLGLLGTQRAHALHSPYWWIRCAGGVGNADAFLARKYHDFLVWELTRRPRWTRWLDGALNPAIGKSLVLYVEKPAVPTPPTMESADVAA